MEPSDEKSVNTEIEQRLDELSVLLPILEIREYRKQLMDELEKTESILTELTERARGFFKSRREDENKSAVELEPTDIIKRPEPQWRKLNFR